MRSINKHSATALYGWVICSLALVWGFGSCADRYEEGYNSENGKPLVIQGSIEQECVTRADDGGFADGDRMGVFVVDYEGGMPGTLKGSGNRATNFGLTYNQADGKWTGNTTIYWKDNVTPVDVYGYYPFENGLTEVDSYPFTVAADQSLKPEGEMSAYEQSDFLWAKATNVQPTTNVIRLSYRHRMAGVKVILEQGTGFTNEEWSTLDKLVTVDNTLRNAEISLATGVVTPVGAYDQPVTMAPESNETYRAVVVPQTVKAALPVISVTIDKKSYQLTRESDMTYTAGKLHQFTITVDKRADTGDYEATITSEEIKPWENDESSHHFALSAYVTVHVETAGTLEACLTEKGTNIEELRNLKVTGELTDADFQVIRDKMPWLTALNLRETKMVHARSNSVYEDVATYADDMFPQGAVNGQTSLRTLILPESITRIGSGAISGTQLTNQLVIPNSVKRIDESALSYMPEINLEVVLPDSLEYIGNYSFYHSNFTCEFKMPNTVRYIGDGAFVEAVNFYGTFRLPDDLEYLGTGYYKDEGPFAKMGKNMTGDIVIPQSITEIPNGAFNGIGFAKGTTVTLHDGVTRIGTSAFSNLKFNAPITLPASLVAVEQDAFFNCRMMGACVLPDNISVIGRKAFATEMAMTEVTGLNGELTLPSQISVIHNETFFGQSFTSINLSDQITHINERAFWNCQFLKTVSLGKNVDYIGPDAFGSCGNIQTFVCLSPEPPSVSSNTFSGLPFDKAVLEVPENSVERYRNASVWNQFLNITAHKELAFNIPSIACLQKGMTRTGTVRSEGEWEVIEAPSWCTVAPMQGGTYNREEVTVTVASMSQGSGNREGRIVFQLKGTDYTTYTDVIQYDYAQGEDTEVVLQEASAGAQPVRLFIVGEGFDAAAIADGTYLDLMRQQMEHFFNVEPYRTYRNYFTVSTALAVSPDAGMRMAGTVIQENKFDTGYDEYGLHSDTEKLKTYIREVTGRSNLVGMTVLLLVNNQSFVSTTIRGNGSDCNISICTLSGDSYPYDQRGLIQHELGGHNFAYLGDESVGHFEFIRGCPCPGCNALNAFNEAKAQGAFGNLSLSGSINNLPWNHLFFDQRYSDIVDVYEGGYNHLRGVYRSEAQSCMGTYIPYYNSISREIIVRRIMELAGEPFDFEAFVAKDSREGIPENE